MNILQRIQRRFKKPKAIHQCPHDNNHDLCKDALSAALYALQTIRSCPNCSLCRELADEAIPLVQEIYPDLVQIGKNRYS